MAAFALAKSREWLAAFLYFMLILTTSIARKHELKLQNEARKSFELSKFGFLKNGFLKVEVSKMVYKTQKRVLDGKQLSRNFGFSLEKTASDGISPYMEQHAEQCILQDVTSFQNHISVVVFIFDLTNRSIVVNRYGSDFDNLSIGTEESVSLTGKKINKENIISKQTITKELDVDETLKKKVANADNAKEKKKDAIDENIHMKNKTENNKVDSEEDKDVATAKQPTTLVTTKASTTAATSKQTTAAVTQAVKKTTGTVASEMVQPTTANTKNEVHHRRRRAATVTHPVKVTTTRLPLYVKTTNHTTVYYGNFTVMVNEKSEEGLYNLYFHNCANYLPGKTQVEVDIHVKIVEKNKENYLSAGEEPLPFLFGTMAIVFFLTACYWLHVLRQNRDYTFKVHYMMFVLILLKSLDLVFESVNFYFIGTEGIPSKSWAVMFYITHLLKGALLFTTIVLIGTGYFFVKHVLSVRDKKIFMIVIPLQILANSAQIVMDSTEEAKIQYATWKELFILVDLLCCGAILFPVVWSIRHLQEASKTDGKAALNLAKLKLFRHFYVMIVCYIYFTRIIVYLVKITVPFQYMWFDEFFKNVATYFFFILTGYKFRPAPDNPYLHVPQEDSDGEMEMDEVVTTQGFMQDVTRVKPTLKNRDTSQSAKF